MNRKIAIINDLKQNNRMSYLSMASIVSAFGDRAYVGIEEDERYDAFISGYIKDSDKILDYREKIADKKLDNNNILYLCDPAFADNGEKYAGISESHIDNYKKLMEISDIIILNFTEALYLTDMPYEENAKKYSIINYENNSKEKADDLSKKIIESLFPLLDKIRFKKNQITIITGIELYNAILTILDVYDGDHGKRQTTCNYSMKIDGRTGVGDVFDAMFFEVSTNGFTLVDALSASTSFINNALRYCKDKRIDPKVGLFFEPILVDNINVMRKKLSERVKNNANNINAKQNNNDIKGV